MAYITPCVVGPRSQLSSLIPDRARSEIVPQRLLIVDDQLALTKVVSLVARQAGFETMTVNAPQDAAQAFIDFKPDVVMVDMIMPEMDGIDVLHQIFLTNEPAHFILTSGYGNAYLRFGAAVAEFHERTEVSVLKKPFRREELLAALGQVALKHT